MRPCIGRCRVISAGIRGAPAQTGCRHLQALAAPNTVVLSAATYHLVQGALVCQALGVHALKGVAHPLPVYRAVAERTSQNHFEGAAAQSLTPLVGREQDVGLLCERWEQVKEGLTRIEEKVGTD